MSYLQEVEISVEQIENLAAIIRRVDSNHKLGAAALAEAILVEQKRVRQTQEFQFQGDLTDY